MVCCPSLVILWLRASMSAGAASTDSRQACSPSASDSRFSSCWTRAVSLMARSWAASRSACKDARVTVGPAPSPVASGAASRRGSFRGGHDAGRGTLLREPITASQAVDPVRLLKALADPTRLRLVSLVAASEGGESCVCDLTEPLGLTQPTISHHLKILVEAGIFARDKILVEAGIFARDKRGIWAYYALVPSALSALSAVLHQPRRSLNDAAISPDEAGPTSSRETARGPRRRAARGRP